MSRVYVISNSISSFTGPKTVVELGAATNTLLEILRIKVTQGTSETDDSTDITWGYYTASGTGTNVVANVEVLDPGDAGFSGTAEDNHTADISTGEIILGREGISTLAGFEKIFLPEARPIIPGGGFFAINCDTAIASVTLYYEIEFIEKG
ncbi:MAG: hypothetical protein ACYTGS_14145 [Planctomycetota bacterium]|jgi:hypothetical protein